MTAFTDDQACVVASVDDGPYVHQRTIPAWAAKDKATAAGQRDVVRQAVRAEVGSGPKISTGIVPGYCSNCKGVTQ